MDSNRREVSSAALLMLGRRACGLALVLTAFGTSAYAGGTPSVPEIDAGSLVGVMALLSGGILVMTNRRRPK